MNLIFVADNDRRPPAAQFSAAVAKAADDIESAEMREMVAAFARESVNAEAFEFGTVTNDFIAEQSGRAGPLLAADLMRTPYDSVLYFYTVTGLADQRGSPDAVRFVTLVQRVDDEQRGSGYFVADFVEVPVSIAAEHADLSALIRRARHIYLLSCVTAFRSSDAEVYESLHAWGASESVHGSAVCGAAAMTMTVNTRNVRTRVDEPAARLQAKRARHGRPPLPKVTYVDTAAYALAAARTARGGTHASPVPHLRRGHIRTLGDGRRTWVRDALVNCRTVRDLKGRDHYEIHATETTDEQAT